MENIEKQISSCYYKSFYDAIEETVNLEKPDYSWLKKLFIEIRDRILLFVKIDSVLHKQINEQFDVELFDRVSI